MRLSLLSVTFLKLGIAAGLILVNPGCAESKKTKDNPPPPATTQQDPLNLSVAESDFAKSKYCGDTRPATPVDPTPPYTFDQAFLDEKLKSDDGLVGWMHGAVHRYKQYLFTYRKQDPDDVMAFFKAEQFSLVPATAEVARVFATLSRHDKVRLKGSLFNNRSPLRHLQISSVEIIKKYDAPTENTYPFDASKLNGATKFNVFAQVHATVSSPEAGYAVVLERDNFVMPVAVLPTHESVAKELYKGDIVSVDIQVIPGRDGRPPHFMTDNAKAQAIKIVDPLLNCHGTERAVEGHLVKFDKSPAINTDVYAVRVVDGNGIARNMTFFPDVAADDPAFGEIFMAISAKAKKAWNDASESAAVVRNYHEKKTIKVIARGKINVVSMEQANAQVYLKSADDVDFEIVAR